MENQSKTRKFLILVLCGIAGSAIYRLPYLRETYYEALMQATGSTNAQLGMIMGAYGIVNLILYLPGGWAADKFSARNLMTFSLLSTGITGFYFATFPPFPMILALHGLWAVTTVFTFWAACIKVIRKLGDSHEQGKLFGYWFLGKGLTSTILGFITVPIFSKFGEGVEGLRATIIFFSIVSIVTGILCYIVIPKDEVVKGQKSSSDFHIKDAFEVFKMPAVWLAGIASLSMWCIYTGFGFMTPYFTDVLGMGESQVALVSIVRANVLFAVGGLVGGKLADKCKTISRFMVYAFIGMIVFTTVYIIMPDTAGVTIAIANMIALGTFIYCANAVFFSLIDEARVPVKLTGTAAGLISIVTYSSDVFLYTAIGNVLDNNPGAAGYKYVFMFMIACAVVGLICSYTLSKKSIKAKELEA